MSSSDYYAFRNNTMVTGLSFKVRKRIYDLFASKFGEAARIADVGVTSEAESREANVLEDLHPFKERITAIGIEDASYLEKKYPGLTFKQVLPNQKLPFEENYFDVTYSHAVIEHIVNPEERLFFVSELLRIGKSAFITTPNKYFPIETHTFVPALHFLWPGLFYFLLDKKIVNRFYNRHNLKLLNLKDLTELAVQIPNTEFEIRKVTFFGFTSNLALIIHKKK